MKIHILSFGYRLSGESQMQVWESWSPPISLGVRGMGNYPLASQNAKG